MIVSCNSSPEHTSPNKADASKKPGSKLLKRAAHLLLVTAIAVSFPILTSAQEKIWPIDFEHSFAAFSLNSSRESAPPIFPGMAKVAGFAKVDKNDPAKSTFELNIYPARQEEKVLNHDGTFRVGGYADLSRYTLLMFQSKRGALAADGRLMLTGDLTVTHVEREPSIAWNNSYTGAQNAEPEEHVGIREVTFTVENSVSDLRHGERVGFLRISARAVISRKEFTGLWTWMRNSVWPLVVENENCVMPQFTPGSMRDYRGASCEGNLIENPLREPVREEGRSGRPGFVSSSIADGDNVTILVQLRISEPQ